MRSSILLHILFMLFLASCQGTGGTEPSVLLIAVEGLSGTTFTCSSFDDLEKSGFRILCDEAVRFTHAFTPSPMAQPALASILTAVHPRLHGLRDNGQTFLTASMTTLPEQLNKQGLRTFFAAAAPTIKRFSRLHQGFQVFNDDYEFNAKKLYRPISETTQIFQYWLDTEVERNSFFAILHSADLMFPQIVTQSSDLEARPRGIEGQIEELDEELFTLFQNLKKRNLWDKIYVVLVGLNGLSNPSRFNEIPGTNLYSENVLVPFFFKPLKGREEIPRQWKTDGHVTLQDLGATLREIYSMDLPSADPTNSLKGISLLPLIQGRNSTYPEKRSIIIESAWSQWALHLEPRYSIRDEQWLVIFDKYPLLYNALTDRNEVNRVPLKDSDYQETIETLAKTLGTQKPRPYVKPDITMTDEFHLASLLFENEGRPLETYLSELQVLIDRNKDSQIMRWLLVDTLVHQKKWELLETFNEAWKDESVESLLILKRGTYANELLRDSCLGLLANQKQRYNLMSFEECQNEDFLLLSEFLNNKGNTSESILEKLSRTSKLKNLQYNLMAFDLAKGGIIIAGQTPLIKDLVLFRAVLGLPKYQKANLLIENKIAK